MASGAAHIVGSNGYSKEKIQTAKQQRQYYGYGGKSYAQAAKAAGHGHHHGRGYYDWWGWSWPDPKHGSKENAELRRQIAVLQAAKDVPVGTINEPESKPEELRTQLKAVKEDLKKYQGLGYESMAENCAQEIAKLEKRIGDTEPADKQVGQLFHQLTIARKKREKRKLQLDKAKLAFVQAVENVDHHETELAKEEIEVLALEKSVASAAGHLSPTPQAMVINLSGVTAEMEASVPRLGELARELREVASEYLQSQAAAAAKPPPEQDKGPEVNMGVQAANTEDTQQQATPEQEASGAATNSQEATEVPKQPEPQADKEAVDEQQEHQNVKKLLYDTFVKKDRPAEVTKEEYEEKCWVKAEKHAASYVIANAEKRRRQCL